MALTAAEHRAKAAEADQHYCPGSRLGDPSIDVGGRKTESFAVRKGIITGNVDGGGKIRLHSQFTCYDPRSSR